jgi:PAS domain S-box-containing protein
MISKIGSVRIIVQLLGLSLVTAAAVLSFVAHWWLSAVVLTLLWLYLLSLLYSSYRKNVRKVAFMFDAIDNADFTFKFATEHCSTDDRLVNESLNRITQILVHARMDAQQKEKYYELILDSVNTGIVVVDEKGSVFQTNREALRLLGMDVFTHVDQLARVDESLPKLFLSLQNGDSRSVSFQNERDVVHLSVHASAMKLKDKEVRILSLNDIDHELDEKEIDSWIRLTRVLTHEIMNSVTPITSLSDTLLSDDENTTPKVRQGLETISSTGKGLIDFVENYRKFTHIPTPQPSLFYVKTFAEKMKQLAEHQFEAPNIRIDIDAQPRDLIVYADEGLIMRVMLNLLKNAMQAIGKEQADGLVTIRAYCNENESVFIEVSDNGPMIPEDEREHVFVPFFTTKEGGSGIGLPISRQIMRLSGGSLTLRCDEQHHLTIFTLMFP